MNKILFVCALLCTGILFSQNKGIIKGSVSDAAINNEPMLFANITLLSTDASYQTNFHGNFEIPNVSPGSHTVRISYAGYETKEITLIVNANSVATIATILSPMEIGFETIEGTDTVEKQAVAIPPHSENLIDPQYFKK